MPVDPAYEARERARVLAIMARPNSIFVFGSNEVGIHGAGAAKDAVDKYGAILGVGEGPMGRSYAIPTKQTPNGDILPPREIREYANRFIAYACAHPELTFALTRVGCGLAGYTDRVMSPIFRLAPKNVELPLGWRRSQLVDRLPPGQHPVKGR